MPQSSIDTFLEYPPGSGILVSNWDGSVRAEFGTLPADDAGKVQCHFCGEFFIFLGSHLSMKHHVSADDYRAIFGLRYTQALMSEELSEKKAKIATEKMIRDGFKLLTGYHEGASEKTKGRPQRLQAAFGIRGAHPITYIDVQCVVCGNAFRCKAGQVRNTCSDVCLALRKSEVAVQNSSQANSKEWWASLSQQERDSFVQRRAQTRVVPMVEITCVVCEKPFSIHRHHLGKLKTCSKECRSIHMSKLMKGRTMSDDFRHRASANRRQFWSSEAGDVERQRRAQKANQ